ncbi:MAG TPA: NAD(P)-dependent alcohol dehydrogenase [Pyrinomonadaceae bacterium]
MKAMVYHKSGSGDVLKLEEVEKPVPKDDEVLIKVRAASVNALDYHLLRHAFLRRIISTRSKIKIAGRDVAGEVEAVGRNVTQFKVGDKVFGACNGTFAEYACTRESALAIKPDNISFAEAASSPVAALTALQGLRDKGQIQPGEIPREKVLINGAAGGVGTFAVQIAKSFGAEVTGVCSTVNVEMVRSIGADTVIDYTREDFTSNGQHYDVIFDLVSNHSFSEHKRALTRNGIYIAAGMVGLHSMIGLLSRRIPELVLSPFVSQKFVNVLAKLNREDLASIAALMETGKVTPVIDKRYSLSEAGEAVLYLEEGHARGKVIIDLDQSAERAVS